MMIVACLFCLMLFLFDDGGSKGDHPVNFYADIIPVLTKAGCNSGACHGAAAGRGGLHLSLLGSDPAADFESIVHDLEGRRVNLAKPDRSLIFAKPTGQLNHGGDVVLASDGPGAKRMLDWIAAGARPATSRKLTHVEVAPRRLLSDSVLTKVPLQVMARFDEGSPQDVTQSTVFTSADPGSVEIDANSVAHIKRRGQHVVLARFLDRILPIQLSVPFFDKAVDLGNEPSANFIDEEVVRVLSELKVPISPQASDAIWLRRVTLDLTGRLPQPEVAEYFLQANSPGKRNAAVESLLLSEGFVDYWTLQFAKSLRLHSLPNEKEGMLAYDEWLRAEIRKGTGLDEIGRTLLIATGDSHVVGPANFGRMVSDARDHAELVGTFFLGMRLGCANCHNHPLDKWTQDDYHGLAAVFAKLDRGRHVHLAARGAVTNLRTNEPAVPRIPGERFLSVDGDHREEFARWAISSDNRYFAKAMVNRLWRSMFSQGLVEPADDLRDTNPATHPELLNRLANDFVSHGYSLRHTLKLIALSRTYGRDGSNPENEIARQFYSHYLRRPMMPEVLADAIADVTGVQDQFPDQPIGTRAIMLVDSSASTPSLDILGRCSGVAACSDGNAAAGGLPAQLHLLNGEFINSKVTSKGGRLHDMIARGRTDEEIVSEFYLRAMGQRPATDELKTWSARVADDNAVARTKKLEDLVWSLLNSREFAENR